MRIPNPAHIPSFEVLLAFLADRESRIWELHIQGMPETWWSKRQDVLQDEIVRRSEEGK